MQDVSQIRQQTAEPSGDPDAQKIADAIKTLLAPLSPSDREGVLRKLTEMLHPIQAPRAGEVLGAIIDLFKDRQNWTVGELKMGVESRGVEATPKAIYNALGYLTRKGHVQRIGYGQYLVDGVAIVTTEELGGTPTQLVFLIFFFLWSAPGPAGRRLQDHRHGASA